MTNLNSKGASLSLIVGHMTGMIDIAALPIWVGTLIAGYGFQPAAAGGLVTMFLGGIVVSSVLLSPFFHTMSGRWMPSLGFFVAAGAFATMTITDGFLAFAIAHLVAGFFVGLALSFVHGTMARTTNPHRIFAFGGLGLGMLAVVFFGVAPPIIANSGPHMLFVILAGIMAFGGVVVTLFFPAASESEDLFSGKTRFNHRVWLVILGIMCMALVHAMANSFIERIGADHGFTLEQVQFALVTMGVLSITPSIFATLLQKRLPPLGVAITGALVQAIVVLTVTWTSGYGPYLACVIALPFIMIFTHTFVFGHLARIEPTGRANAATPAMTMTGSATGPLLGGVLVQSSGYPALGIVAAGIAAIVIVAFSLSWRAKSSETAAQ